MKSNKSFEFQYEEGLKCRQLPYNREETLKLENSTVYIRYKQWLKDNGVLFDPRLRYPSYFGQANKGVVGVSASKPIEKKKAIIAVPYHLLITADKVKLQIELFQIVKENVHFFKSDDDAAMKLLILYISNELLKGEKSFYFPYFNISNDEFLNGWESKALHMLENRDLMKTLKEHKESMELQFMHFLRIYRRYDRIFPQNISNNQYKKIFQKSYIFITTRAFGWSLPSISLIPLGDSFNHSNIRYVNHFLVNIDEEKSKNQKELLTQTGYHQYRNEANLAILKDEFFVLTENELAELRKEKKSKCLKFVEKHKDILIESLKQQGKESEKVLNSKSKAQIKSSQYHILHQQYKAGIHKIKNLHFYESSCQEDNDTDEDQLFDRQMNKQKFTIYDREREINEKNKKKEINKLWKTFIDDSGEDEEEGVEEKPVLQTNQAKEQLKEELKQKLFKQNDSSEVSYEDSEDQDDPDWDWTANTSHKHSYFIMSTKDIIKQSQQIYNFYGRRSNKFLLTNYNFVMQDNIYDSFSLQVCLDDKISTRVPASKLLALKQKEQKTKSRQLKLKRYLINDELISICRSYIILWTKKEWNHCTLMVPFDREIEMKTLELYLEIIKSLQMDFTSSIAQDNEEEETQTLTYEERTSIILRRQYKKILKGQETLISKCINFVKKWDVKGSQNFEEGDMKWIQRLKPYLLTLESSTTL